MPKFFRYVSYGGGSAADNVHISKETLNHQKIAVALLFNVVQGDLFSRDWVVSLKAPTLFFHIITFTFLRSLKIINLQNKETN